ncbi:unnamed protein product [Phytophthora lilii]|uniref:Unnamed protein product n=1 Tax=Phytophthora lilii TaxID=2077276 RepID=A0A9W6UBS4_9STRA|nr:unnamed protein product [Phytophthora lilii]
MFQPSRFIVCSKILVCKAMLDPLLEHLSGLSSAEFYQELAAWKDTVEIGPNSSSCGGGKCELKSSNEDDPDDDAEGDALSAFDPSDAIETVSLMNQIEDLLPNADGCTDSGNASGSEDDIPPTQQTTLHDTASASSNLQIIEKSIADGKGSKGNDLKSETSTTTVRAVDIVNLPPPKRQEWQRNSSDKLLQMLYQIALRFTNIPQILRLG